MVVGGHTHVRNTHTHIHTHTHTHTYTHTHTLQVVDEFMTAVKYLGSLRPYFMPPLLKRDQVQRAAVSGVSIQICHPLHSPVPSWHVPFRQSCIPHASPAHCSHGGQEPLSHHAHPLSNLKFSNFKPPAAPGQELATVAAADVHLCGAAVRVRGAGFLRQREGERKGCHICLHIPYLSWGAPWV